ncbi:ATPase components of various ABC-type transport systems, contain duplicated ATPase [Longilinea arvoryzae]|uniref:ATPase components of various ABC-type transport systems, contain duplicated ATPase n=1 Tax=Longilinea arvoryzae TaxID=360412 RepID=A0A0S7BES5_9CHLR|nr:energy-coupling factor transporter ATPase [Longilinea arvoryzae]GAP13977.1 ATPase components of various ABC-type transport systems, contain duplicated ATPase [Longilinea arvoryzae]
MESSQKPIIQLKNVSYRYPRSKRWAILHLNLEINQGEFVAIMGENGAGKSTFCQMLNGIIPNSIGGNLKGQVLINDLDTQESGIAQLATQVGIVLEDPETQLFTTSVSSEVAFGPENLCQSPKEIYENVKWALDVVRLNGLEDRMPLALSGGQKQRLAIAANIAMRPNILVLDEATSQLDPVGVEEVLSVARELNQKYGMTIVMATDASEMIARVMDRVIVLDKGQLIAQGTPREIFSQTDLFQKYMIRSPQVSQVAAILKKAGQEYPTYLPITTEEAVADLTQRLNGNTMTQTARPEPAVVKPKKVDEPIIVVDHLDFTYQPLNVNAVKDISFTIQRGEFVALIGQNGSGKTTVLKNLLGLNKPTKGKVTVAGMDIGTSAVADMAKHVGFVLQNPDQQLFAETVEEEISYGPKNIGLSKEVIEQRVAEALKLVDLEDKRKEFPPALSKGDRAKTVIASALALNPEIVILDEPTTGQDYRGCHQIMQIADQLHEQGRTVVFVTHHMALVAEYARRVIVMSGGKILMDGPTADIFNQPDVVRQAFIIPPQITELGQRLPAGYGLPRTPLSVKELSDPILEMLN